MFIDHQSKPEVVEALLHPHPHPQTIFLLTFVNDASISSEVGAVFFLP
jgi:hypothetical protein